MGQDAGQENFYFPTPPSPTSAHPAARTALLLAILYIHDCAAKKKKKKSLS